MHARTVSEREFRRLCRDWRSCPERRNVPERLLFFSEFARWLKKDGLGSQISRLENANRLQKAKCWFEDELKRETFDAIPARQPR